MSLEKNLKRTASAGDDCLVCEKMIASGDACLLVAFNVPVLITTMKVEKYLHLDCAKELRDLIDKRLKEGGRERR